MSEWSHATRGGQRERGGFSLLEMIMVIAIIGVVAAIVMPKFADAGTGRRLSAAKRALEGDVEIAKRLARAKSITHTLKFYPAQDMYVIIEGTDIKKEAVVLARDLSLDPYGVDLSRTDRTDDYVFITPYGDLSDSIAVGLLENGIEIKVGLEGRGISDATLTESDSDLAVNLGPVELSVDLTDGVGLGLGLGK